MDDKKNNDVIGVVPPVDDEIDNIGNINPEIEKVKESNVDEVEDDSIINPEVEEVEKSNVSEIDDIDVKPEKNTVYEKTMAEPINTDVQEDVEEVEKSNISEIDDIDVKPEKNTVYEKTMAEPINTESHQQPPINDDDQNKKVLAGIMGIIFGAFGVHNFIYGYTGKGIAQLLITILSCGLLAWVSAIWGFVEGIMILTDNIKPNKK